jgi:hypothetical protein
LLARFRQGSLGLALLGDVPRDLGEADELTLLIADRINDDARPEAAAVFAHAPTFDLEFSVPLRLLQRKRRQSGAPILFRVESREMRANDFVRAITLHSLGTTVPIGHAALRIEHEDRVVDHALHEEPEAALAVLQRLLGDATLGHVARDLGKSDEPAPFVVDGVENGQSPEARPILAQAPTLVLEPPNLPRRGERATGQTRLLVLGREKHRKVPPQHLLGAIALDALGTRVPAGDAAVGIDHVDRVIGDGFHQHLEASIDADGTGNLFIHQ